jgi:carboxyl-terminal processing protease
VVLRNNPRYSFLATILALGLFGSGYLVGLTTSRAAAFSDASADAPPGVASTFGVFWQAWNLAEQHYVNRQALDPTKMTYGAVAGMLSALGDDGHTRFLSPADVQSQKDALSGHFVGIGIQVALRNGHPVVVAPIAGSPAQQAGLRSGDEIVAVDGQDVDGLAISQVSTLIRGAAGTRVTLSTVHSGETTPVDVSIVRGTVTVPSVSWAILPGTQTAQVRVSTFAERTTDDLVQALTAARLAGATSLILDLRDDPGGIRDEAIGVASQFVDSGDVLLERNAEGGLHPYPVRPGGVAVDRPLAVLINEGSASSSEIVAGAIQDHQRGPLVGATTFGTGTVLSMYPLADGSAIYLGTAEWLTPNGRQIWHHGIVPDDAVTLPASGRVLAPDDVRALSASDFAASQDAQLLRAVQLVDPSYATSAPATTP